MINELYPSSKHNDFLLPGTQSQFTFPAGNPSFAETMPADILSALLIRPATCRQVTDRESGYSPPGGGS
jgi:hypothetical protein